MLVYDTKKTTLTQTNFPHNCSVFLQAGVIDPAKVTRTAIQAAASIAGLLLTNEAIVADDVAAAAEVRRSLTPVMPGGQQQMLQY